MQKENNKNLVNLNTFRIDAFCDEFYEITNSTQLQDIDIEENSLILGSGSNILITKRLSKAIHLKTKGILLLYEDDKSVKLKVQAGEIWDDFVEFCVKNNYYGAENLSLIPGTVGASPIQNIGAYGAEVKDIIESVEYFDIATKTFKTISKKECHFEYRSSIFKNALKGKAIVTAVNFVLQKNGKLNIKYGGLKKYFDGKTPTLLEVRNAVIKIRQSKLPDTKILGNSGSFFKNAIVKEQKICEIKAKYGNLPYFKVDGGFKIPTAWLIETANLKGFRHKNTGVYENHALILVNLGGATAQHILELSEIVKKTVFEKFGVVIEKEVNVI